MPMLSTSAALFLCAGALATGALVTWIHFRLRIGTDFVALESHRQDVLALRRRYRQRLRAIRDAMLRHKLAEHELRSQLRVAEDHHKTQDKLLAAAQAEAAQLRARIAAFERDQGLLRIERDELAASTQRLRALTVPEPAADTPARAEAAAPVGGSGVSRAELADRNARIHELQCRLRESETRMTELQSSLNTWKYRIAPLALHMKMQRDKLRAADEAPAPASTPDSRPDELQRIRGIGPALAQKLQAQGINRFEQLASMSPAELANLALRAGVAASRPQRDRWALQARKLAGTTTVAEPVPEQRTERA